MKKTIRDINLKGKRAIVRCDFNVPQKDGAITDDNRIQAALPTINYLIEQGARVILMSHLGRPKGEPKMEYSLAPVAERLSQLLGKEVKFKSCPTVVCDTIREMAMSLEDGEVMLLENVASARRKQKTAQTSQRNWLPWAKYLSRKLSVQLTEPTPPPQVLPTICRQCQAF